MQLASPLQSCAVLELDGDGCSWLPLADLEFPDYANGGLCGVCRVPGALVLATQSTPPLLILYDPVARRIKAQRDVSPGLDLHSIVFHEGALLVVSTGTNEIYKVPLGADGFGEPRPYWRYPGVEYDRDLVHLNGLTLSPEGIIATCFGPRLPDGSWGSAGSLFVVEPFAVIADGLAQPHTPLYSGARLFFAESRAQRVHALDRDPQGAWCPARPIEVGGYVRGLALEGERLWIGLSAPRRTSRSRGTPNEGVIRGGGSALVCIDLASARVMGRRALDGLGDEIYDLLILDEFGVVGRPVEALTERISGMQATVDTIRRDYIEMGKKLEEMMEQNQANRVYSAELTPALLAGLTQGLSAELAPALSAGLTRVLSAELAPALSAGLTQVLSAELVPALSAGLMQSLSAGLTRSLHNQHAYAEQLRQELAADQAYAEQIRQTLIAEQAYAVKLMLALQAEQIYAAKLALQLRAVTGSRLWRAAQRLRRLAGRAPYVPDLSRPPVPDLVRPPVPIPGQPPEPDPVEPAARAETAPARPMAEVFGAIYVDNYWGSEDSRSGTGSDLQQTAVIRDVLPALLRELGVKTMLDVPCGDFHWMRTLELDLDYTGADVVADLIAANNARYANERRRFQIIDIAADTLPRVDLVFCRDLLVHFSFADALRAIANLKRSGSTYLLTTTFTNRTDNVEIETGQWRAINLMLPPFNFPPPVRMINENCTEFGSDWADKSLGLWRLVDL